MVLTNFSLIESKANRKGGWGGSAERKNDTNKIKETEVLARSHNGVTMSQHWGFGHPPFTGTLIRLLSETLIAVKNRSIQTNFILDTQKKKENSHNKIHD